MKEQQSTLDYTILGAVLFVGLALYQGLGDPLTASETAQLDRAGAPLADLAGSRYSPVYVVLLHIWSAWFQSPFWLRLFGVLAGLAALFLVERVARHLGGTHATPGAVLLLAASPFLVGQATTISPAALSLVALLGNILCFMIFLRSGHLGWLAGWAATVLASWGIHAGLVYVALIQSALLLAYRERYGARQLRWWVAQIPLAAVFVLCFRGSLVDYVTHRLPAQAAASGVLAEAADLLGLLVTNRGTTGSMLGAALFAVLAASGLWACRNLRHDARHFLLVLALLAAVVLRLGPLAHASYALAALPPFLILVSMGIRIYPKSVRQLSWSAVAVTFLWSHW